MPTVLPELVRCSTQMFPERDRIAAFKEEFSRLVLHMDVADLSEDKPHIEIAGLKLGTITIGSIITKPCEFIRDGRHIRDGVGDFMLMIPAGPARVLHAGKDHGCGAGDGVLFDYGRPLRSGTMTGGHARNIAVPAAALKALVAHPEDRCGDVLRPGPALYLLDGYLASLVTLEAAPSAELGHLIGLHLVDLVAATLGPTVEGREIIVGRGLKAARLRAVLSEIARQFCDPCLSLDSIAERLGVSRRYVQFLLEETGKSFTEHVTERRLQRAYAMLSNPDFSHLRIIDIAFNVGFSDVSHFNHTFRRRFGETPSGVRAEAGRNRQS